MNYALVALISNLNPVVIGPALFDFAKKNYDEFFDTKPSNEQIKDFEKAWETTQYQRARQFIEKSDLPESMKEYYLSSPEELTLKFYSANKEASVFDSKKVSVQLQKIPYVGSGLAGLLPYLEDYGAVTFGIYTSLIGVSNLFSAYQTYSEILESPDNILTIIQPTSKHQAYEDLIEKMQDKLMLNMITIDQRKKAKWINGIQPKVPGVVTAKIVRKNEEGIDETYEITLLSNVPNIPGVINLIEKQSYETSFLGVDAPSNLRKVKAKQIYETNETFIAINKPYLDFVLEKNNLPPLDPSVLTIGAEKTMSVLSEAFESMGIHFPEAKNLKTTIFQDIFSYMSTEGFTNVLTNKEKREVYNKKYMVQRLAIENMEREYNEIIKSEKEHYSTNIYDRERIRNRAFSSIFETKVFVGLGALIIGVYYSRSINFIFLLKNLKKYLGEFLKRILSSLQEILIKQKEVREVFEEQEKFNEFENSLIDFFANLLTYRAKEDLYLEEMLILNIRNSYQNLLECCLNFFIEFQVTNSKSETRIARITVHYEELLMSYASKILQGKKLKMFEKNQEEIKKVESEFKKVFEANMKELRTIIVGGRSFQDIDYFTEVKNYSKNSHYEVENKKFTEENLPEKLHSILSRENLNVEFLQFLDKHKSYLLIRDSFRNLKFKLLSKNEFESLKKGFNTRGISFIKAILNFNKFSKTEINNIIDFFQKKWLLKNINQLNQKDELEYFNILTKLEEIASLILEKEYQKIRFNLKEKVENSNTAEKILNKSNHFLSERKVEPDNFNEFKKNEIEEEPNVILNDSFEKYVSPKKIEFEEEKNIIKENENEIKKEKSEEFIKRTNSENRNEEDEKELESIKKKIKLNESDANGLNSKNLPKGNLFKSDLSIKKESDIKIEEEMADEKVGNNQNIDLEEAKITYLLKEKEKPSNQETFSYLGTDIDWKKPTMDEVQEKINTIIERKPMINEEPLTEDMLKELEFESNFMNLPIIRNIGEFETFKSSLKESMYNRKQFGDVFIKLSYEKNYPNSFQKKNNRELLVFLFKCELGDINIPALLFLPTYELALGNYEILNIRLFYIAYFFAPKDPYSISLEQYKIASYLYQNIKASTFLSLYNIRGTGEINIFETLYQNDQSNMFTYPNDLFEIRLSKNSILYKLQLGLTEEQYEIIRLKNLNLNKDIIRQFLNAVSPNSIEGKLTPAEMTGSWKLMYGKEFRMYFKYFLTLNGFKITKKNDSFNLIMKNATIYTFSKNGKFFIPHVNGKYVISKQNIFIDISALQNTFVDYHDPAFIAKTVQFQEKKYIRREENLKMFRIFDDTPKNPSIQIISEVLESKIGFNILKIKKDGTEKFYKFKNVNNYDTNFYYEEI